MGDSNQGDYVSREFSVVIERDSEGYYVASVPALYGLPAWLLGRTRRPDLGCGIALCAKYV